MTPRTRSPHPPAIKICGITDDAAMEAVVLGGAEMVGLVFFPPSPRAISPDEAAALLDGVPYPDEGGPERVGLFVDADQALIDAVVNSLRLDWLQFHGSESPERVDWARLEYGLPVIKALPVATPEDLAAAVAYAGSADRLLLDARPPPGADRPGGHARAFDWSVLEGWTPPLPWLLAGGLTPDTVAEAIRITGAPAVDVSSGVECGPGIKDPDRIAAFIRAVRET